MKSSGKYAWVACVLGVVAIVSAIVSVYARHESRRQFAELQQLTAERDELEVEWGKLQLEQSLESNHSKVEEMARERIGMRIPGAVEVEVVKQ